MCVCVIRFEITELWSSILALESWKIYTNIGGGRVTSPLARL